MKKVVLNPNPTRDKNLDCTRKVVSFFRENGVEVCISKEIIGAETTGATLCDFEVAAKDADIDVNKALSEISLEKDGNNSSDDTDDSITAVPRDICSVIRGIERRVRLLNRSRKRATFTVDRCKSKIVITLNIKA